MSSARSTQHHHVLKEPALGQKLKGEICSRGGTTHPPSNLEIEAAPESWLQAEREWNQEAECSALSDGDKRRDHTGPMAEKVSERNSQTDDLQEPKEKACGNLCVPFLVSTFMTHSKLYYLI